MLGQAQHRHAVAFDRLDRHQPCGVDLAGHAEQRAAFVRRPSRRAQCGPGGIARRQIGRFRLSFRSCDEGGETGLAQRRPASRLDLRPQRRAVEPARIGIFPHGLALLDQPLALVYRIERQGCLPQCRDLRADAEEAGDEILHQRPEIDHQRPFRLCVEHLGGGARGHQAGMQVGVGIGQMLDENPVEPHQPVAAGKVVECQSIAEGGSGHGRCPQDIISRACAAGRSTGCARRRRAGRAWRR